MDDEFARKFSRIVFEEYCESETKPPYMAIFRLAIDATHDEGFRLHEKHPDLSVPSVWIQLMQGRIDIAWCREHLSDEGDRWDQVESILYGLTGRSQLGRSDTDMKSQMLYDKDVVDAWHTPVYGDGSWKQCRPNPYENFEHPLVKICQDPYVAQRVRLAMLGVE